VKLEARDRAERVNNNETEIVTPGCGGRLRLLATIEEPQVVRKILSHLGIPTECPEPLPARSPPLTTSFSALFDIRDG
jgi:hypothetical protein